MITSVGYIPYTNSAGTTSAACPVQVRVGVGVAHDDRDETVQQEVVKIRETFASSSVVVRRIEGHVERDYGKRLANKDDTLYTDMHQDSEPVVCKDRRWYRTYP